MKDIKFRAWDFAKKEVRNNGKGWYKQGGYILQKAPYHPRANSRGYVAEHILIIENSLNRYLLEGEVVHHINQVRDDNRIENLEVMDNQPKHIAKHDFPKRNDNGRRIANEPIFEEIKFRLHDKDTGVTRIYTLSKLIGTTFRRGKFEFRGRFTGLKDKNGSDIYEGDILRWTFWEQEGTEKPDLYEVRYEAPHFLLYWFRDGVGERDSENALKIPEDYEIVGNIWENPELLKI